jgi:hypothetical protein
MKDFVREYFDRLLLVFVYFTLLFAVLFLILHKADPQNVGWAREQGNTFAGALIGLITGVQTGMAIANKQRDKADVQAAADAVGAAAAAAEALSRMQGSESNGKPNQTNQ